MARDDAAKPRTMSVAGAAFLGVGAMVGAGIFALLGEAGAIAGSAVWLSFLAAGVISGLLGYTVAKLGVRYPSGGGIIAYLTHGFGKGHVTGVASWLFYFAGLIVTAMVAVSFGNYGAQLLFGDDAAAVWVNVLATGVVIALVVVNAVGANAVAKLQTAIVVVLMAVFAVFIVVTLADLNPDLLARSTYPPAGDIISSVALTFFAFLGFAVVSFTAGDLRRPERDLPRAMYLAIGLTTTIYVLVALGVFGTLTPAEVTEHGDTALAYAAKPALGQAGFAMMALAALLATSSSVNANLFAAGGITSTLAKEGLFPAFFGRRGRRGAPSGLVISGALVLLLANVFDLSAIASIGSAVALMIFLLVSLAALRLRHETGTRAAIVVTAIVLTVVVLAFFAVDTLRNEPWTFVWMVVIALAAVVLDQVWTRRRDRAQAEPRQLQAR